MVVEAVLSGARGGAAALAGDSLSLSAAASAGSERLHFIYFFLYECFMQRHTGKGNSNLMLVQSLPGKSKRTKQHRET